MPLLFLCMWMMEPQAKVIVLPPDPMVVEDTTLAGVTFNQYRRFVDDRECFMGYDLMIKTIDELKCATIETPLEDVKSCLEKNGFRVMLVKAEYRPELPYFYTGDGKTFGRADSFFDYCLQLYCPEELHMAPPTADAGANPTEAEPKVVESNVAFDAYLLSGRNGLVEDAFKIRLIFKRDSVSLLDVDTNDPIEVYHDDVVDVQAGQPIELVTRTEVFYLQLLEEKKSLLKRLQDVVR